MRWTGHVAHVGERRGVHTVLVGGHLSERYHFADPGIDRKIILRWIFWKWDVRVWTGSSWLSIGTGGGHM